MDMNEPATTTSATSATTAAFDASLSRSASAKRKRRGKSPLESSSLLTGRLYQPGDCRSTSSPLSSTTAPPNLQTDPASCIASPELLLDSTAGFSDMTVQRTTVAAAEALCQISVALQSSASHISDSPPSTAADAGSSLNYSTWSFLSHPSLRLLPKWPGLYQTANNYTHRPKPGPSEPKVPDILLVTSTKPNLQLLSLLSIPPVAASLASNLYGHDLLNLRRLNSSFKSLLSIGPSEDGERPYFHTLLLKSLLCPRMDEATEPVKVPCRSAGGNVGPCMFCGDVICTTCVSPEIWTIRRYRYICPLCATPIAPDEDTCNCQSILWTCRRCYISRWLEDLHYSSGGWTTATGTTCSLCKVEYTYSQDHRLPFTYNKKKREPFKNWIASCSGPIVPSRGKRARKPRQVGFTSAQPPSHCATLHVRRRPVACGWCHKRVDPEKEDWFLRPETIRKGEEKGKIWLEELERRRQREGETQEINQSVGGGTEHSDRSDDGVTPAVSNNP